MVSGAKDKGFDLTKRQWLIWAEHSLSPDLPLNNMAMSAVIDGDVDSERFERAFEQVVGECEALRTTLVLVEDSPRRFIQALIEPAVEHVDLSGASDPDLAYSQWRDARCRRPFEMERRLFDCALVRLGPRRVVWYLCQDHIISDAWSFGLIFDRTAALYEQPDTSAGPSQADATQKQLASEEAYLASDRHGADRLYWGEHFSQPVEALHPYGIDPTGSGPALRCLSADLGMNRSKRLKSLLEDDSMRAATPALGMSTLFTTALFAYLHRITGNTSIGIGIPVQNRPSRWSKNAVGRFAETCPMHVRVEPGETFRSLHAKVAQESFSVLAHARCTLANPLRGKRYDAMLNFHNLSVRPFAEFSVAMSFRTGLASLPAWEQSAGESTDNAPHAQSDARLTENWQSSDVLTLNVHDYASAGQFQLGFEFNADVFDEELGARAVEHFSRLIDALVSDPGQRIDAVSMATATESASVSLQPERSNRLEPGLSLLERFRMQVAAQPKSLAVRSEEGDLSFLELDTAVRNLSAQLRMQGFASQSALKTAPQTVIGVFLGASPLRKIISILAVHEVGAVYLPLDPREPEVRLRSILTDATPQLILTDAAHEDRLPAEGPKRLRLDLRRAGEIHLDDISEANAAPGEGWGTEDGAATDFEKASSGLACLVYAASTSGGPAGVEIEHSALGHLLASMSRTPGLTKSDRVLPLSADSFGGLVLGCLASLCSGASVDCRDSSISHDALQLAQRLEDPTLTLVHADSEIWQMLIDSGWSGRPDLRVMTSGRTLSRSLADGLLDRAQDVWSLSGDAECTFVFSVEHLAKGESRLTIGRPVDQARLLVLTPNLEPVPSGTVGELYVGGAGLARGYRGRPTELSDSFVCASDDGGMRLYRTGERVRLHLDGRIESLGRFDHRFEIDGSRIALEEIEAAILHFENVSNGIVTVHQAPRARRQLVGHLELDKEEGFEIEALEAYLRTRLPSAMVPSSWQILDDLPRTSEGRLDRDALVNGLRETPVARTGEPPRGDIENQIAELFRELLEVATVARDDDFFDLGGQSLLAVEATRRLGLVLKRKVELSTFFQNSTVARLAEAVQQSGVAPPQTMAVKLRSGPEEATLFCIAGVSLYQELANAFVLPLRVYGVSVDQEVAWIEAVERGETPHVSDTEETARQYVASLRELQPKGPYRLAGFSYGGVLAFEIAQQLLDEGEEVAGVVLLDARLHGALADALGVWGNIRQRIREVRRSGRWAFWRKPEAHDRAAIRDQLFVAASKRYEEKISPYAGSALLCRVSGYRSEEIEFDETLGWGRWIQGGLTLANCPGDHLDLLSPENAAKTAGDIERYLGLSR